MKTMKVFWGISGLIIVAALLLSACSGMIVTPTSAPEVSVDSGNTETKVTETKAEDTNVEESKPATVAEPAPEPTFPEILVLHPDAYDIELLTATNTYVYYVPMMVAETTEYMLAELEALGWQPLGKPTVMGHLATINMQDDNYRLTISMQDNDLTQSTRIQMILLEK